MDSVCCMVFFTTIIPTLRQFLEEVIEKHVLEHLHGYVAEHLKCFKPVCNLHAKSISCSNGSCVKKVCGA